MSEHATRWTPQQAEAIRTTGVNLLVSAAAGSGKTAVLAERCAYLICDASPPCNVDQLLVVTFTETAAAEMRGRIETALRGRLEKDPDSQRLRTQIAQIDRAQVSTLHAFCFRVLRQHYHLVGLDPNVNILDGDEAKLLRLETVRALFAERYEIDDGGVFNQFIDIYGNGQDEGLQGHVIRTHELLCSVVDPQAWVAEARRRVAEGTARPLGETTLGKELAGMVHRRVESLTTRCGEAIAVVRGLDGVGKYLAYLTDLAETLAGWKRAFGTGNFDALAGAVAGFKAPTKPSIPKTVVDREIAGNLLESIRAEMGSGGMLGQLAAFSSKEWSHGLQSIEAFTGLFLDLVVEFGKRYAIAKQRVRAIDFSDLERLTLQVLRTPDGAPSSVARGFHRRIAHVLVDEYQDINGVQESILNLVSRECVAADGASRAVQNLFCVGDVKQSIYGFRLAEPARFLARYERFKLNERSRSGSPQFVGSEPGTVFSGSGETVRSAETTLIADDRGRGKVIDLQANFRSRPPLLEVLNGVFERLMTKDAADLDYDESQKLRAGATFPPSAELPAFAGAPLELHLLPNEVEGDESDEASGEDLDRMQREASFIAMRIHELLGHDGSPAMQVADRDAAGTMVMRPLQKRDIVVLLRSTVQKAARIASILEEHGIAAHRDAGTGYFETTEIRDMLALLQLLDNAQQDIPLAAVLRSPLANLVVPEDSLGRIRLAYQENDGAMPFHEAVSRYATEQNDELAARLRDFFANFERWRQVAQLRPLAELVWHLYDDTGYLAYCSGLENGRQRVANLMYLHGRAKQFGAFSRQGLYRFLTFLKGLQEDSDIGPPSVLGPGEDVVRIMSIHRSKGLEFPVVFLPDLGKRMNLSDSKGHVLIDRAVYLGLSAVDPAKQVRYPSLALMLVSERLRQQAMAEELRVLYVAMTRAKEHLILVGTCGEKDARDWSGRYRQHKGPLPTEIILKAGCVLDWIGPVAAAMDGAGEAGFTLTQHTAEELRDWSVARAARHGLSLQQLGFAALKRLEPSPAENPIAAGVIERLGYVYPHQPFSERRAAIAVTEWSKKNPPAPQPVIAADLFESAPPQRPLNNLLPLPRAISGELELSAADRGTATHLVLEHLDFQRPCTTADLDEQITSMVERKLLLPAQAKVVDRGSIIWFAQSELGEMLRRLPAADVIRESTFNLALQDEINLSPETATTSDAVGLDRVMLRGRIDLLLKVDGSYVIIDYKTDRVSGDQIEQRGQGYEPQVRIYKQAIAAITGAPVSAVYLVFLAPRRICRM
jgi:ATP-dependent helicase/nuclease subunit A